MVMIKKLMSIVFVFVLGFSFIETASGVTSGVHRVELSWGKKLPNEKPWSWKKEPDGSGTLARLKKIKFHHQSKNYKKCYGLTVQVLKPSDLLFPWLMIYRLTCALKVDDSSRHGFLINSIKVLDHDLSLLSYGPYSRQLSSLWVDGHLELAKHYLKNNKKSAWHYLNRLTEKKELLSEAQQARLFALLGELSFMEQRFQVAKNYVLRSLSLAPNRELEDRLLSIEKVLRDESVSKKSSTTEKIHVEGSKEEQELLDRMIGALKGSDVVPAIDDGLELIKRFPGSRRAEWASKRIFEVFGTILNKRDSKFDLLKGKIFRQLVQSDLVRKIDWANQLCNRGEYLFCLGLLESVMDKGIYFSQKEKVVLLAARAAHYSGDLKKAELFYQDLIDQYSGTKESIEALFSVGLIQYQKEKWAAAVSSFERLLASPHLENKELPSRYWLVKSLEKISPEKSTTEAERLIQDFPLTYYGIRLSHQLNKKIHYLNPKSLVGLKETLYLLDHQYKSWQRLELLLKSGWHFEAEQELKHLDLVLSIRGKILVAQYFKSAGNNYRVIELINEVWRDSEEFQVKEILQFAFPLDFKTEIEKYAKKYSLHTSLIRGMIRQESGFQIRAESVAQALGLMQIIPLTAKDIAEQLGYKTFVLPEDLLNPDRNIEFGSYYIAKLLKRFDGQLPVALAAYNVGPTRLTRWLKNRQIYDLLLKKGESDKKDEKANDDFDKEEWWIQEMPWGETRHYVQAVLRNAFLYSLLEQEALPSAVPIWNFLTKPNDSK